MQVKREPLIIGSKQLPRPELNLELEALLKLDKYYSHGERLTQRELHVAVNNPLDNLQTISKVIEVIESFTRSLCGFCDCVARMINQSPEAERDQIYSSIADDNSKLAYEIGKIAAEINGSIKAWSRGEKNAMGKIHSLGHPAGTKILAHNIQKGGYELATSPAFSKPKKLTERGFTQIINLTGEDQVSLEFIKESKAYSIISKILNDCLLMTRDSLQFLSKVKGSLNEPYLKHDLAKHLKILGGSVVRITINPKLLK